MAVPSPTQTPQTPETGPIPENPEDNAAAKEKFAKAMGMAVLSVGFQGMSQFKEELDEIQNEE